VEASQQLQMMSPEKAPAGASHMVDPLPIDLRQSALPGSMDTASTFNARTLRCK
jgi:hypothetical protein